MSVMSPGLDKLLRLWPTVHVYLYIRFVLLIFIFLVSCTVGRPSKEVVKDKSSLNYYSTQLVQQYQPQNVPLYGLVPNLRVPIYQPQTVYFSPGFGYFPQYYGGPQPHLLQSYHDLPSFQYGSIQPVPQQSFQHVETHSLPEELHSIQSFQYSTTKQQKQEDIPKVKPQIISRNVNATKNRRRKIKKNLNRQLDEFRQKAAEKDNSVSTPIYKIEKPDTDIKRNGNGSKIITENEQAELNSEDLEPEPATNIGIRLPFQGQSMRRSRSRTRRRQLLLILSSILTRNGGSLLPSQKVSRQASAENPKNEFKGNRELHPKKIDDSDEMMEFSEPESSVSAAMAMKYGMNLISSTIPAPEPTTPAKPIISSAEADAMPKKRNTATRTTLRLKPSEVDYEVPEDAPELINDVPPRPVYTDDPVTSNPVAKTTPVFQNNTTPNPVSMTTTVFQNNATPNPVAMTAPVTQNNNPTPEPAVSADYPRSEISAKYTSEDYNEFDLSDLPPLPAIDQDDSFAPTVAQITPEDNENDSTSIETMEDESRRQGIEGDQMIEQMERQPETGAPPQQIPQTNPSPSRFEEINSDLPPLPGSLVPAAEGDSFTSSQRPERPSTGTSTSEAAQFDDDQLEVSGSPDLPPIPDISLFPSTAEQDEPDPPPFRPIRPTQTPRPTSTTESPPNINIPIFNDNVPPFPVTDDGSLPELPFPAVFPEDTDGDQHHTEQEQDESIFVEPATPAPTRRTTERPRPSPRIPVALPRIPPRPIPTARTRVASTSTEAPVESECIPTGNNDWLREVALKALDRGISFQQVYSINVGHVVINSGGSTSEYQNITPKPFYQLIQEQLIPAITSLVQSQTRPGQFRPNLPNTSSVNVNPGVRRTGQGRPVASGGQVPNLALADEGSFADSDDLGLDFAPLPLGTEAEANVGISEQELFSTRLNTTRPKLPNRRRPSNLRPQRPNMRVRPTVNTETVIANRDEVNQTELPNLGVSPATKPFRPLPEDEPPPRIKQNIDPRSLDTDSFPFQFPEGTEQDEFSFRSALVNSMQNYRSRTRTANGRG